MTVKLEKLSEKHLELVHQWENSDIACGLYDEPSKETFEQLREKFDKDQTLPKENKGSYVIFFEDAPVGFCVFNMHPWDHWIAVIGVIIAVPEMRGKQIGTKAHSLLVEECFANNPKFEKIEAVTDIENISEVKLLEKLGFKREGTLRKRNKLRGEFRTMHFYGMTREDWKTE